MSEETTIGRMLKKLRAEGNKEYQKEYQKVYHKTEHYKEYQRN